MPPPYRFDRFELDPERRELRRDGEPVPIQPRPLDLLLYLVRHADRVVPRQELHEAVWRGTHVNDEALGFAVHQARRAVGDDGTQQRVIRTVARSGFRFVASLARQPAAPDASGFVGRKDVLENLRQVLGEVQAGARRLVLLGGEAGIGKTRTAERMADIARGLDFAVFTARCVETEGAPVFWPWIQLLRPIVQELSASDLADALGPGAPELARLLPEIRRLLHDPLEAPQSDAKAARFLLFDSVTALVRRVARDRPLLLLIDDLHRSDVSSLLLLRDLTRQLAGEPVLILATHRDVESARDPARAERIAELVREEGTRSLALTGLSVEEVGELLSVVTGYSPSSDVRDDLMERTNGNPFFLQQVIDVLESEGRSHELEMPERLHFELPRQSRDAIAHQVTGLPRQVVFMLEAAAVIGREFSPSLLGSAFGLALQEVLATLQVAGETRIIHENPENRSHMRFTHVLLRDALYHGISRMRRAEAHLAVGKALLEMERRGGQPTDPSTVAHHFLEAIDGGVGDVRVVLDVTLEAGRWAEERLAFGEAAQVYERALRLADRATDFGQDQRCQILLKLGNAYTNAGVRGRGRECFAAVARAAKLVGLPSELASAALWFAPDFLSIETGVFDSDLVAMLEEAIALLPEGDVSTRAKLLARLAVALYWAPDSATRRSALCAEAISLARDADDPGTLRYALCARSLAQYTVDTPEQCLGVGMIAEPRPADGSVPLLEQALRMTRLLQLARLGEFERGIHDFELLAHRVRQPHALWYVSLFRATLATFYGDLGEADHYAARFRDLGERAQDQNAFHSFQLQRFLLALDRGGDLLALEKPLKDVVATFQNLPSWRSGLALFYAEVGREDEASREIERILALEPATMQHRNEWLGMLLGLSLASATVGHREGAETAFRLLEPHADHLIVVGFSSACWGSASTVLGATAASLGWWDTASRYLSRALSMHLGLGARPALLRTMLFQAELAIERGMHDEAERVALNAAGLARGIGLHRLATKAEAVGCGQRRAGSGL